MQAVAETSSKEWEDFNVHKAFVKVIETGMLSKNMAWWQIAQIRLFVCKVKKISALAQKLSRL